MSDNVRISITAKDDASDDFQRIGANAAKMGQQVTQAGRSASQGLKPIDQSAKTAQTALVSLEREAAKVPTTMGRIQTAAKNNATTFAAMGAAATTLAGFLSDAARAAAEEEAVFAQLEAAVDATGESFDQYAGQIDQAIANAESLSFADDAAASGLTKLTTITQDAGQALDLMGLAMDVARGRGISLAEAATLVGRAAEGSTAGLSRMGIVLQEGATAQEALAAIQSRYAGQAEAYAATTQGAYDRVKNTLDNFIESIGGSTGELQLILTLLPGLSAGYTLIGGAAGLAAKGIQTLRASSSVAALALGPVGLGLVAVAGGAAIAYKAWEAYKDRQDNAVISTQELEDASRSLLAVMSSIRDIGGPDSAITALNDANRALEDIVATSEAVDSDNLKTLKADLFGINETMQEIRSLGMSSEGPGSFFDASDLPALEQQRLALQATVTALEGAKVSEDELAAATVDLQTILSDTTRTNYPQLINAVVGLTAAHDNGQITNDAYLAGIARLADEVDTYGISLNDVIGPIDAATEATRRLIAERNRLAGPNREGFLDPNAEFAGLPDATAEAERNAAAAERAATGQLKLATGMAASTAAAAANAAELREAQSAVVDYIASGENLLQLLYESGKALSGEQGFIGGVIDLQNALTGLESAYSIIIDGSERLGATSASLADWAQGLIDAGNAGPALDSLNQIIATNADVQADILAIQQAQAPYLAALNADTAAYVDNLSRQDAQQQRNVLTLMDANSQQQLAAIYAAATDAAMGNLGANGTQFVQSMVDGLRITNPLLYEMLQTSGNIDANGVFQFDGGDANALVTTLTNLNTTLGDLADLIAEVNGLTISPKVDPAFSAALRDFRKPTSSAGPGDGTGGSGAAVSDTTGDGTGGPLPAGSQQGHEIVFPVRLDVSAFTAGISEVEQIATDLAGGEYTVEISANGETAYATIYDVDGKAVALVEADRIIPLNADGTRARGEITNVEGALGILVGGDYVARINGDGTYGMAEIAMVNEALNVLNGTTGVIYINGDGSSARGTINSLTGVQGYATIIVNAVRGTSAGFTNIGLRDGGVVGYDAAALDGIVTHGGYRTILTSESGPEIMRVPPGTSVTPAPMTSALTGNGKASKEMHFHFHAPVYGVDDLQQMIGQAVRATAYQGQY